MDVYTVFFTVGFLGGIAAVTLAWLAWWRIECHKPIHCWGCRCQTDPSYDQSQEVQRSHGDGTGPD